MGKKKIFYIILASMFVCCNSKKDKLNLNNQIIYEPLMQKMIFHNLVALTEKAIHPIALQDSLGFLILPVEASCPSCRRKAIDSIVKYKDKIDDRHFIIITGTSTKKIRSYFDEQGKEMPIGSNRIFIDSTNQAFMSSLIFSKPTIYYSYQEKVYQKISCIPTTIKSDLRSFFSKMSQFN